MGDRGGRVDGAPRLPDSPLAEHHERELPAEVVRWRGRAAWVGSALLALYGLGAAGLAVALASAAPVVVVPHFEILATALALPAPPLLVGLCLLRLAARWGRWSRTLGALTVVAPPVVAIGHVHGLLSSLQEPGSVIHCGLMLAAEVATILVGALASGRLAKPGALVVVLMTAAAMVTLAAGDGLAGPGTMATDPWSTIVLVTLAGVPLAATVTSAWLVITLPPFHVGEARDV